jgi:hypothetical protein
MERRSARPSATIGWNSHRTLLPLLCALPLLAVPSTGRGADGATGSTTPEPQAAADRDDRRTLRGAPCPEFMGDEEKWLEKARTSVERSVCVSAWGFDSLFGNREEEELGEARAAYGRLRVGTKWDEQDGLDPELRLRATVPLPLMERRLRAVVGRETDEEFLEDASREFLTDPLVGEEDDVNWLVGLGYDPIRGRNSRLSLGAGVKLQTPLNPYLKASYRYYTNLSEEVLLRAQQTVFWENEEGLGTSTRAGIDWLLNGDRLLRWNNYLKLTEETRGTYWNTNLTVYQRVAEMRAIALRAGIRGETGREYSPVEYSVDAIYRQPFLRDWLFVEIRGGGGWLRRNEAEQREFVPRALLVFEMVFGRHPMLDDGKVPPNESE